MSSWKSIENKLKATTNRKSSGEHNYEPLSLGLVQHIHRHGASSGQQKKQSLLGQQLLFTSSNLLRWQSQLSPKAPTKWSWLPQTLLLQNCFLAAGRKQHWKHLRAVLRMAGSDAQRPHHTPCIMPPSSLYPALFVAMSSENLHFDCLNNNLLWVLFQPQQKLCKCRELSHSLTQRSEAHGDIQQRGTVPAAPTVCSWFLKSLRLENPDPDCFPAGYS